MRWLASRHAECHMCTLPVLERCEWRFLSEYMLDYETVLHENIFIGASLGFAV